MGNNAQHMGITFLIQPNITELPLHCVCLFSGEYELNIFFMLSNKLIQLIYV